MGFFIRLCCVLLLVAGCVPYSMHPLTDFKAGDVDTSVIGTWSWNVEGETGYVHIGLSEDTGKLRIAMIDLDRDHNLDILEFTGHTSTLDRNHYLNLKQVASARMIHPGYLIVKYQVDGRSLSFSAMDMAAVRKAIRSGQLEGRLDGDNASKHLVISENQERLREAILLGDKVFFPDRKTLFRNQ